MSTPLAPGPILLLGGRSEIGLELAERLAPGREVVLAARRSHDVDAEVARLVRAGATGVRTIEWDAADASTLALDAPIGVAILAFGLLGDQALAERDAAHATEVLHVDFVAQAQVLTLLANHMREGHIVVFSSIAGVRVRRANYVYGSAKAGLDGFASGLADRLHGTGVHLLLVRPGFVIGRMTEGMAAVPLFSSTPAQVADATVRALGARARTVWIPRRLAVLAAVSRVVPAGVWRRMPR